MRRALAVLAAVLVAVLVSAAGAPAAAAPGPANAPEYWFDQWRLTSLWHSGVRGQGMTIAEIDTGVNAALPQLQGRVLPGTDLGAGGSGRTDREVDTFGHGTAMASIMVGRPGPFGVTGMAPGAKILPIAVPLTGTTDQSAPDRLPDAIRYAADHGAKIISMSLGGKRSPSVDHIPCAADEQAAVDHAMSKGAMVIASVGNTGPLRNVVEDPAACLGVVAVGATDASGAVASFSSRQPYVTLVAPGVNIPSLGRIAGQAYSGDGTSQSTAIVAAAAALVWSAHPGLDADQVLGRILATLDGRRTKPGPAVGYGRLDTYRAVTAAVPAAAANPVYAAAAPFRQRLSALHRPPVAPPKAAAPVRTTGPYRVGSAPRFSAPQVVTGIALAGAGLVLLLALAVIGLRGRRRRRRPRPFPVECPVPSG